MPNNTVQDIAPLSFSILHFSYIFKTRVFHVSNSVKIHFKHSGLQSNDTILLLSRNTTASSVCE